MIHESILSCIGETPLVDLRRLFPDPELTVIAKLELLNPGGSVKDRPARFIVEQGLRDGQITQQSHLIESSSGNLGIALAMVARVYGLRFTCVVDPKISPINLRILQNLGAEIDMVDLPDRQGGYLETRISRVQELLKQTPHGFWINQYANRLNWEAHFYGTGDEIIAQIDRPIDYLVMAVSTTGTILGVARRLRQEFPKLRVVAVDAVGSVIFGGRPGSREIPGIGASRVPELLCREEIDEVIYISDWEAVESCRELLAYEGIFAGGSSGSVIAAVQQMLPRLARPATVLTLLPDRGDRYVSTVYDDEWVAQYCSPPAFKPMPSIMALKNNQGINSRSM
jgi:N-(2-amino-2-carboxyethyl)-L-glutamate synthase